jgi:hypothetical protein
MKIYFNRRPNPGPWGGGSKVLSAIVEEAQRRKHQVFFEEELHKSNSFDIYFCLDPRSTQHVSYMDMLLKRRNNSNSKIVQRIGDLGTHGKPELFDIVSQTARLSDVLIYPSFWAKNYLGLNHKNDKVIANAPLKDFFLNTNKLQFSNTIKIVSHHWSNNQMKGFDLYQELDEFCINSKGEYSFLFVGRKPEGVNLTNYLGPQDTQSLSRILPENHLYITASKKEAGANHVLEAMAAGLPVLYHCEGGSINEYCQNNGMSYNNFENLKDILKNKKTEFENLYKESCYVRNSHDMSKEYLDFLEEIA